MEQVQPSILRPPGPLGRFHVFDLADSHVAPLAAVRGLADDLAGARAVVGFGQPLLSRLGVTLDGMRPFPALAGPGASPPSTQGALLCFLMGEDRGDLLHASRGVQARLGEAFRLTELVDTFTYRDSRDLTGYIDGTENPDGDAAKEAAIVRGRGLGVDGGSFVAVQRFVHDLDAFGRLPQREQDFVIGRSQETNEELDEAPESAHVKRTAQESFEPPAFMVRRSMPYVAGREAGLYFVAYGESLDRYERVLRRMLGLEDGVVDALFGISRPVSGGYYFCPPLRDGRLDLRVLAG